MIGLLHRVSETTSANALQERLYPANTKHLYNICAMFDQPRRRWADVVQMLYKWFVFAGDFQQLYFI